MLVSSGGWRDVSPVNTVDSPSRRIKKRAAFLLLLLSVAMQGWKQGSFQATLSFHTVPEWRGVLAAAAVFFIKFLSLICMGFHMPGQGDF